MRRPVSIAVMAALALVAVLAAAFPAGAVPTGSGDRDRRAERVLILSLPNVSWEDLEGVELPNLERFFRQAGVADLAARAAPVGTSRRTTRLGDGYIALGAGTRAVGDGGASDGQGLEADEPFGADTAGRVFTRRTGTEAGDGLVQLAIGTIEDRNDELLVDVVPGALGTRLADAGFSRAVIANADGVEPEGAPPEYRRQAVSALMDTSGRVPDGRVDDGLLEEDPQAPYGLRYDHDAVIGAFQDAWGPNSVVLVEASDLARADAYRDFTTDEQGDALVEAALRRTDELFAELLAEVDFDRDAVLVVGPAHAADEITLTVAALRAPGLEPGLLRSATTRRSGFVQLIDVGPTVLDLVGVERPSSMDGRPFERGDRGGDAGDRREFLVEEDAAARFIADRVSSVAIVVVALHAALIIGALLWLTGRFKGPVVASGLRFGGLVLLAAVPVVYLARLLPLHHAGAAGYWLFLILGSLVLAVGYRALGRRGELDGALLATGAAVTLFVVDGLVGTPLQISSALGNSPIVAGRFTGFGNLAFAAFSSCGLVAAVLLAGRVGGRRGAHVAVAVLAVVLLVDGMPFWGSDVGGVLSMAPAYLVTAVLLLGWRLRWRTAAIAVAVTGGALALFGALDLARAPERRTHLGRLFERIGDDGSSGFAMVIQRKLDANLSNITNTVWAFVIPTALALIVYLLWRAPSRISSLEQRCPSLRAGAIGGLVLLVLGFGLNDSGIRVPALMLVVFDATLVVLLTSRVLATEAAPVAARPEARARSEPVPTS